MKTNPKRFDAYEIHGMAEFEIAGVKAQEQVDDDKAEFWSLFGHVTGEGLFCVGDFVSRDEAEGVCARIVGRLPGAGASWRELGNGGGRGWRPISLCVGCSTARLNGSNWRRF